jgi:hypothetical protein
MNTLAQAFLATLRPTHAEIERELDTGYAARKAARLKHAVSGRKAASTELHRRVARCKMTFGT